MKNNKKTLGTPIDGSLPLEVKNLFKKYGKKSDYAVKDISFSCAEGEVVGILGANGAGKSTTLKCITGMIPLSSGTITVSGYDVSKNPVDAKRNFSFVTDNHTVFTKMTGMQYLSFMSDVYGVPYEKRDEKIKELEGVFKLGDSINKLISGYSHGMKQKICMMGSLIHEPRLWLRSRSPHAERRHKLYARVRADGQNHFVFVAQSRRRGKGLRQGDYNCRGRTQKNHRHRKGQIRRRRTYRKVLRY
jgi:ABC-type sugar transport system ATPase subunit